MTNFAVIGTNFITDYILEASKSCPDFHLQLVHSRDINKAKDYAEKWGAPEYCSSLEEVANNPTVDAVYIATPNATHMPIAIQMLKSKKHVLVEKSAAANAAEWEYMLKTARENNVVLVEALRTAFNPNYYKIKESLEKLGIIRRVLISCTSYSRRYDNFKNGIIENAFNPKLANGALMDLGVYAINFLTGLFGGSLDISGSVKKLHNNLDAVAAVTVAYEDMIAIVSYGKIVNSQNLCEIAGEKGYMTITGMAAPGSAVITYNDKTTETIELSDIPFKVDLGYELKSFISMVEANNGLEDSYNNRTLTSLKMMDKIRSILDMPFPNDDLSNIK